MVAVRPEALVLFSIPDAGTASIATQLAPSVLVVGLVAAQRASQAVLGLLQLGRAALAAGGRALRGDLPAPGAPDLPHLPRAGASRRRAQTLALHGIGPEQAAALRFFRGKGCPSCNKVGYRGRRAIFEVMTASPEVERRRRGRLRGARSWRRWPSARGMRTLRDRCLELVAEGTTTFDEFVRLKL